MKAGSATAQVLVSYREVIDLSNYRKLWEGSLWSDELPLNFPLEGTITLVLPDGHTEEIQLTDSQLDSPVDDGKWFRFHGSFLSERNIRD